MTEEIETLTEEERAWCVVHSGWEHANPLRKLLRLHDALQARVKELEKQAALYDQECGMCGSTAAELVEYAEYCNAREERRARQEHGDED
jgi:bacterioferritin-associated ferredoxin